MHELLQAGRSRREAAEIPGLDRKTVNRFASQARDEPTDTAAAAAIDHACRILRLPTISERHGEIATPAGPEPHSTPKPVWRLQGLNG